MCDGPPSIIRKMHPLARAGTWPGRGSKGPADRGAEAFVSCASRLVSAMLPRPAPRPYRKPRRVGIVGASSRSIEVGELVGVDQHQADLRQPAHLGADVGREQVGDEGV